MVVENPEALSNESPRFFLASLFDWGGAVVTAT
jgi:hypothetical protein